MKTLIICSKQFYGRIEEIKKELEGKNIEVYLPNCYDEPETEEKMRALGSKEHQEFKAKMFKQSEEVISNMDSVLVLNYDKEKNGEVYKNYIGGATFLEMYDAFRLGKQIYLYNEIPKGILYDEIQGFNPTVLNGNLDLIRNEEKYVNNELSDYEKKVLRALGMTDIKFNIGIALGMTTNEKLNYIFEIVHGKWGISLLGKNEIEVYDDLILACYKIIRHSVSPAIVDYVLNYFDDAMKHDMDKSSFLDYVGTKDKKRSKIMNK